MSARETHVTEWGLADCAGVLLPPGRSRLYRNVRARMKRLGLHRDVVACDGSSSAGRLRWNIGIIVDDGDVILTKHAIATVPSCPRCAVLRDEALEGRLPKR